MAGDDRLLPAAAAGDGGPLPDVLDGGGPPVIEVVDVTRSYRLGERTQAVHALRGITFSVAQGGFVAIVGPSGSGKSTLLNLLGALDRPTIGVVRINGVDIATLDDTDLARLRNARIGFVFQQFQLLTRTSAIDNVALPLVYAGMRRAQRTERARDALSAVGLGHRLTHYPNELSGGEQQRVAIARALVGDPDLILADEPTGNLDTATGEAVMALLERLNTQRGVALVVITHDHDVAARAPHQIHLRDGLIERVIDAAQVRPSAAGEPGSTGAATTASPSAAGSGEARQ